jgi:hypothetical protein
MEQNERAEKLEQELKRLDHHADEVGERIDDTRREWEAKEQDPKVPGAQPDPEEEEDAIPGVGADEDKLAEEGGP